MLTFTTLLATGIGSAFATSAAAGQSPAALICESFEGSSASDRARLVIEFSRSIDHPLAELDPRDGPCVRDRLEALESDRRAYCTARGELGHDLAFDPLDVLGQRLFEIQSECGSIRREREGALLDRMLPESCDQLLPSFLALLEFVESNRTTTSKQHFDCARDVAPRHAAELVRSCASGSLSVRAAYVELDERVSRACPR